MSEIRTYPLHIGPTHPTFKEPIRFNFEVEGEHIVDTDIDFGYTHRAIEQVARERNFIQIIYLLERICGICSFSHPMAYCLAVENIAQVEVPDRAKYIRTIIGELERLHSHLLWAGVAAHQIGFDTLFLLTWNIREKVLDILEQITGNRVNYAMLTVGGVRRDITEEQYPLVYDVLDHYRELYGHLNELLLDDISIQTRCRGVGILTGEEALQLCAVGPTARASGLTRDVRCDYPVNAYPDLEDLTAVTPADRGYEAKGDVYDRILVRVMEIKQSIKIIEFCLERMPDGEIASETKPIKLINSLKKIQGEGIGRYEGPRGEVTHYDILDRREGPVQIKVKAPTYSNAITWIPMMKGVEIADIPIVIASIDPCIACSDRMTLVRGKQTNELAWAELLQRSRDKMQEVRKECSGS